MSRHRFPRSGRWVLAVLALAGAVVLVQRWMKEVSPAGVAPSVPVTGATDTGAAKPGEIVRGPESRANERSELTVEPREDSAIAANEDRATIEIQLLGPDAHPVVGARAQLLDDERVRTSDAQGRLRFERPGARGLVVAEGLLPRVFEVPRGDGSLELGEDLGLDVHVVWEDTREPVEGVRSQRVGLESSRAQDLLARLASPLPVTDANGDAHLSGLRLGDEVARLRFEHDGACVTWQVLGDLLDDVGQTPRLEVELPRASRGHRFRIVDAAGEPLVDRVVHAIWYGKVERRTDAEGRVTMPIAVRDVDPEAWTFFALAIALEAEDSWWSAGFFRPEQLAEETLVRVAPVRVHGRVEASDPQAWQVVSSGLLGREDRPGLSPWPRGEALVWSDLAPDGTFELAKGWQGASDAVFLRPRGVEKPTQVAAIPADGGPVTLVAEPTCRLAIEVIGVTEAELVGASLSLDRKQAPGQPEDVREQDFARCAPLLASQVLMLPVGHYDPRLRVGSMELELPLVDATLAEARLEVPWIPLKHVRGTVSGRRSGPLAGVRVVFFEDGKRVWARVHTDGLGRFEADIPRDRRLRFGVQDQRRYLPATYVPPWVEVDQTEIERVEPEAELRVVENPHQPLLSGHAFELHRRDSLDAGQSRALLSESLDEAGSATLHLYPGDYVVRRRLGDRTLDVPITLADGERREVVIDTSSVAPCALEIAFEEQPPRYLDVDIRDAAGEIVFHHPRQGLRESPQRYALPVAPGAYTVGLALHASLEAESVPLATWSGVVHAVPGAGEAVQVDLR